MPRKMSGMAMSTIEELIVAISRPRVVLDSATHLYRGSCPSSTASLVPGRAVSTAVTRTTPLSSIA